MTTKDNLTSAALIGLLSHYGLELPPHELAKRAKEYVDAFDKPIDLTVDKKERCREIWKSNPRLNKLKVAELLGVSRPTIYAWIKEFEK